MVVCGLACVVKWFVPPLFCQSNALMWCRVLVFVHACTHIVDEATSVGPVGRAAVARLVDLALLLQVAGLSALTGTTLNTGGQ